MSTLSTLPYDVALARAVEAEAMEGPQVEVPIVHSLHGGVYTRTCLIRAGVRITGAAIKVPTTLIIHGDALFLSAGKWDRYTGTHVLAAEAGRKQIIVAREDTRVTMIFPSRARTVAEAEQEFTDEHALLQSNRCACSSTINTHQGPPCQE